MCDTPFILILSVSLHTRNTPPSGGKQTEKIFPSLLFPLLGCTCCYNREISKMWNKQGRSNPFRNTSLQMSINVDSSEILTNSIRMKAYCHPGSDLMPRVCAADGNQGAADHQQLEQKVTFFLSPAGSLETLQTTVAWLASLIVTSKLLPYCSHCSHSSALE